MDFRTCGLEDVNLETVQTFGTCGIRKLWTRRRLDSVPPQKSLSAVPDRSQRGLPAYMVRSDMSACLLLP